MTTLAIGIEPSQLESIFDRFSQEEGYLRRLTGATGLGLAICHRIIQGLGGQIWAEKIKAAPFMLRLRSIKDNFHYKSY